MLRTTIVLALCATPVLADTPVIEEVDIRKQGSSWRFDVTLSHADTGWEDYANAWEVRLLDGTVVGTRILAHPHVEEQPFTRSLSGIKIPEGADQVVVFASDLKTGFGSSGRVVTLP